MKRALTRIEPGVGITTAGLLAGFLLPAIAAAYKRNKEKRRRTEHGISYVIKGRPTYSIKLTCENCKDSHIVEYTIGREGMMDHKCPRCGVAAKFTKTKASK